MPVFPDSKISRPNLRLPASGRAGGHVLIDAASIVIIGANGTGKSRLGTWIELTGTPNETRTYRIAAQRSVQFNDNIDMVPLDRARNRLSAGRDQVPQNTDLVSNEINMRSYRISNKYGSKPTARMVDDFTFLLQVLYAEESNISNRFRREVLAGREVAPPSSDLDRIRDLWQSIFTSRSLITTSDSVKACIPGGTEYAASEMSDGERAAFYLIGQCLCAPENAIVIVDEPEVHLHRSIQCPLWDELERLRSDCCFVFLTHDIEFAASRSSASRILLTDFDGTNWIWEQVGAIESVPEDVLLRLAGSRRAVLFVEGAGSSLDQEIYRVAFPDRYIVPLGSCLNVISATKGLRSSEQFHRLDARGIIDRDKLTEDTALKLKSAGIEALQYSEIENVLLLNQVIAAVAKRVERPQSDVTAARDVILTLLAQHRDRVAVSIAHNKARSILQTEALAHSTKADLKAAVAACTASIDIDAFAADAERVIDAAVNGKDYDLALQVLNHKGAAAHVASKLGLNVESYRRIALACVKDNSSGLLLVIRNQLPKLTPIS